MRCRPHGPQPSADQATACLRRRRRTPAFAPELWLTRACHFSLWVGMVLPACGRNLVAHSFHLRFLFAECPQSHDPWGSCFTDGLSSFQRFTTVHAEQAKLLSSMGSCHHLCAWCSSRQAMSASSSNLLGVLSPRACCGDCKASTRCSICTLPDPPVACTQQVLSYRPSICHLNLHHHERCCVLPVTPT
jgi:hypothetical protein